jgi:hypothetical protein
MAGEENIQWLSNIDKANLEIHWKSDTKMERMLDFFTSVT